MVNTNMKNLLLIPTLLLAGCSSLFSSPSTYDPVLYSRTVTLWFETQASATNCGTPAMQGQVLAFNRESKRLVKYTEYASKDLNSSLVLVDKDISEMNSIYQVGNPSVAYCKIKVEIISDELDTILKGMGGKSK
jgi:hypothetical protein